MHYQEEWTHLKWINIAIYGTIITALSSKHQKPTYRTKTLRIRGHNRSRG